MNGRFDPVFLHKVAEYRRGATLPEAPDWKSLQKELSLAEWEAHDESALQTVSKIKDIASNWDHGKDLEGYLDESHRVIQSLHCTIRDACDQLTHWDPEAMSREEMISFVSDLESDLVQALPQGETLGTMRKDGWFHWETGQIILGYPFLKGLYLSYDLDDVFRGTLISDKHGPMLITVCSQGVLRMDIEGSALVFTSDDKISLQDKVKGKSTVLRSQDFKDHFEEWWKPSEEEISLFDVLHGETSWTVLRYLREYEQEKFITDNRTAKKSGIEH